MGDESTKNELIIIPLAESKELKEEKLPPKIPQYWTILHHGTNLAKNEWQGKRDTLDGDILVVKAIPPGLPCITDEERNRDIENKTGGFDTTSSYAMMMPGVRSSEPVEIRILFPNFHHRRKGLSEVRAYYENKYGKEATEEMVKVADQVHYQIDNRHPRIPNGTILDKLYDQRADDKRIVWYVPSQLKTIYVTETEAVS